MNKIYFSQYDPRWKNTRYSSTGNNSQTIGTSGCGPTSAAMVISSLTDELVFPTNLAVDFVSRGFRTAGSGTSWAAFEWLGAKYGLNCKKGENINDAINCLNRGGMVIVSVIGSPTALFSTAGHIMVLSGISGDTVEIMDSALYNGKYDLPHRAGKVEVKDHYIYVNVNDLVANARMYYCYETYKYTGIEPLNHTMRVTNVSTRLRIRKSPDINSEIVGYLNNNDVVTVYASTNNWYNIGNGYVSGNYLEELGGTDFTDIYGTGNYRVTVKSVLNVREEPDVNSRAKTFEELSANAQEQIKNFKGTEVNGYVNNMICHVSEVQGVWGKTPSGWICLDYCVRI